MSTALRIPRFLCPALSRSVKSKTRVPSRRPEPLVQGIAKLEAYIKDLRKDVHRRATRARVVDQEPPAEDEEIDTLYQSISAPSRPALEAPRIQLAPSLCTKLSLDVRADPASVDWDKVVDAMLVKETVGSLQSDDVDQILSVMPHTSRVVAGRRLFDAQEQKAKRYTYDLLTDSYGNTGQADKALDLFNKARDAGLAPTMFSYAHLMNAFSVVKDLPKALALYRHMQEQAMEPNIVVSTSLVATCVKTGRIDAAFSIFDGLKYKSTASAPDTQLYSLMIHACSLDPKLSAERAADLFTEMTERGLRPTVETFNALINVYAKRKEYFAEAWKLSDLMQQNQIAMDKRTWLGLLSACVTNRDLPRARNLVREMMKLAVNDKKWTPDAVTYQLLFRAYANGSPKRSIVPLNVLETSQAIEALDEANLWIDEVPFTSNALLRESAQVMAYLRTKQPEILNSQHIDTYMTIAAAFEAPDRFKHDWNTLYKDHKKTQYSYQQALAACYVFKDWEFLQQVWSEREAWRAGNEAPTMPRRSGPPKPDEDVYGDFEAVVTYIESLARLNRVYQATQVLDAARHKYKFEKKHLKCFQAKSIQLSDEEAVLLYRDMFPPTQKAYATRRRWY